MMTTLKLHIANWLYQPRAPESGVIELVQRRVYILPTRLGLLFAVVLVMMLLGSINYGLNLGFVLTFLLVGLGFNAMLYTFRNLARLQITAVRAQSVFAGETAQFSLNLANPGERTRYAIAISRERRGGTVATANSGEAVIDVPAGASARISMHLPSEKRGRLPAGRLTLFTQFPLGLYRAWSYVQPDVSCIIYPRPAPRGLPLPLAEAATGNGTSHGSGQDDFAGLRAYHPGDPPRHIAWKAAARGQGLLTKQFSGEAASEVWLAWDALPLRMTSEERISCLTRWVLDAHASGLAFGMRLPRLEVPMASGDAHRATCLEALALYETPAADRP